MSRVSLRVTTMYHAAHPASPIGPIALKFSACLIFAVVAVIAMAGFTYNGFIHQRTLPAPTATAAACTPAAIRQVADPLERSVLSAQCAKRIPTVTDQVIKPTR
jgi:entry exclusion lipoprotein TrbK